MDKESPNKKEMRKDIDDHEEGWERSRNQMKKSAKGDDMNKITNEELEMEILQIKVHLSVV